MMRPNFAFLCSTFLNTYNSHSGKPFIDVGAHAP